MAVAALAQHRPLSFAPHTVQCVAAGSELLSARDDVVAAAKQMMLPSTCCYLPATDAAAPPLPLQAQSPGQPAAGCRPRRCAHEPARAGQVKGPTAEHCGVLTCVATTCMASNSLMTALKDSLQCGAHQLALQPRRSLTHSPCVCVCVCECVRKCMCAVCTVCGLLHVIHDTVCTELTCLHVYRMTRARFDKSMTATMTAEDNVPAIITE